MFGFVAELERRETAQSLGERTQSIVEELRIGVSVGDFAGILSRGSAFAHQRFLAEFVAVFELFLSSHYAVPWRPM